MLIESKSIDNNVQIVIEEFSTINYKIFDTFFNFKKYLKSL